MIKLIHGDCLEKMKDIPDKSIDMVLADIPYGVTACKWDVVIPLGPMWEQLKRITKDDGAIILFGSEPFSSHLRLSNLEMFKYDWIWEKTTSTGFVQAKKRPLLNLEILSVFHTKQPTYLPQGLIKVDRKTTVPDKRGKNVFNSQGRARLQVTQEFANYPKRIIKFASEKGLHTSQKPVALLEYLIKTYTLEGETVLDFTMGSGSTGVAAKNLNRSFIGIEKDDDYFNIAKKRIEESDH